MPIIHEIENLLRFYEKELDDTLNFWYKFGIDRKNGGFFTCLERDGTVYDSDKSVWAQGRGLWVFSKAYNDIKKDDRFMNVLQCVLHHVMFIDIRDIPKGNQSLALRNAASLVVGNRHNVVPEADAEAGQLRIRRFQFLE